MIKLLNLILALSMVVAGCASLTDIGRSDVPPVINAFAAQPGNPPGAYILTWDVSGATKVRIEPDIGDVGSDGTSLVLADVSTQYVLTATNEMGSTSAIVYVAVLESVEPDLRVTGISQCETADGYAICYTLQNRGRADAGASTTELYINGEYKDEDYVDGIAAGASVTRQFTGWACYSAATESVEVVADAGNTVKEANEDNNKKQLSVVVTVVYDFVNRANMAIWKSGPPPAHLFWGGAVTDEHGCACYREDRKLEDDTGPKRVLQTRPKWVDDGWIQVTYQEMATGMFRGRYIVQPGDRFVARVGFLKRADGGEVTFRVMIRPDGGPNTWIATETKAYDGTMKTIDVALQPWAAKRADFVLEVQANGSSLQDWAVWEEAKIIRR